ncbi:hypothetical protein M514_00555 [Trichuris suis]|uniref:Uncharacterized protein n=1 Tax=Trichuris suis TaxID=68888 RepID=A0A085MM83_9BILA|nr:hypothetical protein M513_00555 [Trichuris suis]KFD67460.1 hypothetical protein M514_00555 [Trichuris suis]
MPPPQRWSWQTLEEDPGLTTRRGGGSDGRLAHKSNVTRDEEDHVLFIFILYRELSKLRSSSSRWHSPNLVQVHGIRYIKDKYPALLPGCWELCALYGDRENDHSDRFAAKQHYALLCNENSGTALEGLLVSLLGIYSSSRVSLRCYWRFSL